MVMLRGEAQTTLRCGFYGWEENLSEMPQRHKAGAKRKHVFVFVSLGFQLIVILVVFSIGFT